MVEDFQNILEEQTVLFQRLAKHQLDLQEALFDKNYPQAEQNIDAMTQLANAIHHGEYARQAAFENLLADRNMLPETEPSSFLTTLDSTSRGGLAQAFRNFKIAVLQARTCNEWISTYSSSRIEIMEDIINELYPERRDGTYTAKGQHQKTARPLVLDHSF